MIEKSIQKLIDYLEHDEKKHFESCTEHKKGHIYIEILKVKKWLKNKQNTKVK